MSVDLRQLRQFVAIAELGSFRRAADALHIAQPALSVSIQKLEHAVGVKLLDRSVKGVTVTPAGEALMQDARRSLFFADQARRSARRVALGELGDLRLGFVGSATYALLPQCLPRFRARYPQVQLALREETTVRLIDMLRANEIDAAVIRGPIADDPDLEVTQVERDDLILAVPTGHALAGAARVALHALRGQDFVLYAHDKVPGLFSVTHELCRRAGFSPRVSQEAIQVQTVVSLVASGMGVALVPAVARAYSNPHVRFIDLLDDDARGALSLSIVINRDGASASAGRLRDAMLGDDIWIESEAHEVKGAIR